MHKSYEAGMLEDPQLTPPEDMFDLSVSPLDAPDEPTDIVLSFKDARPTRLEVCAADGSDSTFFSAPLDLFYELNRLGGMHGIGRVDMVENRFVGIKSRGVYETPGGTILQQAHRDLEGITMDREVMHLRDSLTPRYSELVYYGLWYSPEMELLRAMFDQTQEYVTGEVVVGLYKGNVTVKERRSPVTLYDEDMSSMDRSGGFEPTDSTGFIRTNAHRLRTSAMRARKIG